MTGEIGLGCATTATAATRRHSGRRQHRARRRLRLRGGSNRRRWSRRRWGGLRRSRLRRRRLWSAESSRGQRWICWRRCRLRGRRRRVEHASRRCRGRRGWLRLRRLRRHGGRGTTRRRRAASTATATTGRARLAESGHSACEHASQLWRSSTTAASAATAAHSSSTTASGRRCVSLRFLDHRCALIDSHRLLQFGASLNRAEQGASSWRGCGRFGRRCEAWWRRSRGRGWTAHLLGVVCVCCSVQQQSEDTVSEASRHERARIAAEGAIDGDFTGALLSSMQGCTGRGSSGRTQDDALLLLCVCD